MADNTPEIVLDGDVSPLRRKLKEAAADLTKFGKDAEGSISRLTTPLGMLQSRFAAISVALTSGTFSVFAKSTIDAADSLNDLSQRVGVGIRSLAGYKLAADQSGVSLESVAKGIKAFSSYAAENGAVLKKLGIDSKDADHAMVQLADIFQAMPDGMQKTALATKLFGKAGLDLIPMLNLGSRGLQEARDKAAAYGDKMAELAPQADQFNDRLEELKLASSAAGINIVTSLMPALTRIATAMAEAAKEGGILSAIWVGLGGLGSHLFTDDNLTQLEKVNKKIKEIKDDIAAYNPLSLFGPNLEELKRQLTVLEAQRAALEKAGAGSNGGGDKEKTSLEIARERVALLKKEAEIQKIISELMGTKKDEPKKAKEETSFMTTYEARLAEVKNQYEQENGLREFNKEQELAYWRELLATYAVASKDRTAIAKKTADLELDIRRKNAKDQRELDNIMVDHDRNAALAQIQYEEAVARNAQDTGAMTKRELLDQEDDFARRRFEIEYQAAMQRLELLKADPTVTPAALAQAKEQMLDIERNYQLRRLDLGQNRKKEENSLGMVWDDGKNAFDNAITGMLTKAQSLQQGLASIFGAIYQSFIQNMVAKPVADFIASQAKMLAVKLGFVAQEKAIQTGAAASTVGLKAAETTAVVSADAAQAGAGAAASMASIPYVGPALALAAMATVFAAVMALGSRKSAARGYDIPRGLNPVTQLHEEEMVLPQQYANVIRSLAAGEGGAQAAPIISPTFHIQAFDSRDVKRFLMDHKGVLADALKSAYRDGKR